VFQLWRSMCQIIAFDEVMSLTNYFSLNSPNTTIKKHALLLMNA